MRKGVAQGVVKLNHTTTFAFCAQVEAVCDDSCVTERSDHTLPNGARIIAHVFEIGTKRLGRSTNAHDAVDVTIARKLTTMAVEA